MSYKGPETLDVISRGIEQWKFVPRARVEYLLDPVNPSIKIPRIFIPSREGAPRRSPVVILKEAGHHEEPSGFWTLSDPKKTLPIIDQYLDRCSFVFYPLTNLYGPHNLNAYGVWHPEHSRKPLKEREDVSRRNENGINYNDGWGIQFTPEQKTHEGAIIERDTDMLMAKYDIVLGVSQHEDSFAPGRGYIWLNGEPLVGQRQKIQEAMYQRWHGLFYHPSFGSTGQGSASDAIEWDRFVAVDSRDDGSWETYLNDQGIPTVLSEAPYGGRLDDRILFHQLALAASLDVALQ